MAFEGLTEKLNATFKKLRGKGRLTENDVREAMREVRLALLEADVGYKVVKDFVATVTERAIGSDVIGRIPPDDAISRAELTRRTVIESAPDAPSAAAFAGLARFMLSNESGAVPLPMDAEALEAIGDEIARRRMGAMQP